MQGCKREMKKMLEIEVDNVGNVTLGGKPIKVKPIGRPFVVPQTVEDIGSRSGNDARASFQRSLDQTWNPPTSADAYAWSGLSANSIHPFFEQAYWALQAYKIIREVEND